MHLSSYFGKVFTVFCFHYFACFNLHAPILGVNPIIHRFIKPLHLFPHLKNENMLDPFKSYHNISYFLKYYILRCIDLYRYFIDLYSEIITELLCSKVIEFSGMLLLFKNSLKRTNRTNFKNIINAGWAPSGFGVKEHYGNKSC